MSNFILQLPLKTEQFQLDILNGRFEVSRFIYNSLLNISQKRYCEMIKTKCYRSLIKQLYDGKNKNKEIQKQLTELRKSFRLNEYALHEDVRQMQHHFKIPIDAFTAQKIATRLWSAYDDLLFHKGKSLHFKKYGTMDSVEGKSNTAGIRFKNNTLFWNGLVIPLQINPNNQYEQESLRNKVCYCRVVRKFIKNQYKYYLQLTLKGVPPVKLDKFTGLPKHQLGQGDVGLDFGTQTIAITSDTSVKIIELADKVQNIENQKRILLRKIDRSRHSNNQASYNDDGTVKNQGNKKVTWFKSNRYKQLQSRLRDLYRKQADIRKLQHEQLANEILVLGDTFYGENMNYKALQSRAKKTEVNDAGRFKKKKRYGKSLANKAPAMFVSILSRKLSYYGKKLILIDTRNARASQFNHFDETYTKKKLSQRWNDFSGIKVQRDMYSAFLIQNISDDLKTFNIEKCSTRFNQFYQLHQQEVIRLTGNKNLSSIAI